MKKLLHIVVTLLLSLNNINAQKWANHWFFGDSIHLDFSSGNPIMSYNLNLGAFNGSSCISDSTSGKLLFFTNGIQTGDSSNHILPNSINNLLDNKGGDLGTLIVPLPNNDSIYYLFNFANWLSIGNNNPPSKIKYSIINKKLNNGKGDYLIINNLLSNSSTSSFAATHHSNGRDIWIIGKESNPNNNNYDTLFAFLLTPNGINLQPVKSVVYNIFQYGGYPTPKTFFQFSPNGKHLIASLKYKFAYFDFDNTTGIISNFRDLYSPNFISLNTTICATFSPDNSKLYISAYNNTANNFGIYQSTLLQYNANASTQTSLNNSQKIIFQNQPLDPVIIKDLRLAPNGKIYIETISPYLYCIPNPNSNHPYIDKTAVDLSQNRFCASVYCDPNPRPFNILVNNIHYLYSDAPLPNFVSSMVILPQVSFQYKHCSLDSTVTFSNINLRGDINFLWYFDDAASGAQNYSTSGHPIHNFASTGAHTVRLIACNAQRCDTFYKTIWVPLTPPKASAIDTLLLTCPHPLDTLGTAYSDTNYIYSWQPSIGINNSMVAQPICNATVNTQYVATITDTSFEQCFSLDTVFVKSYYIDTTATIHISTAICPNRTLQAWCTSLADSTATYQWQWGHATALQGTQQGPYTLLSGTVSQDTFAVLITQGACSTFVQKNYHTQNQLFLDTAAIRAFVCPNNPYITSHGTALSTSGIYYDTIVNTWGCDSVLKIILNNNATTYAEYTTYLCQGQIYQFPIAGSLSYTIPGTYYDTTINRFGCDSILKAHLVFSAPSSSSINIVACPLQHFVLPSGKQCLASGIVLDTVQNGKGCDSIITVHFIKAAASYAQQQASICANETYTLPSGTIVNTAGIYIDTILTYLHCDSIITTQLAVLPISQSTQHWVYCPLQIIYLPSGKLYTGGALVYDTLINYRGCDSIISIYFSLPTPTPTFQQVSICAHEYYVLPSGTAVQAAGIYTDTIPNYLHCDSIVTTNLIVLPVTSSSIQYTACTNETTLLPSGKPVVGLGVFYDTILNFVGCDSIIQCTISKANAIAVSQNISICSNQTYTLPNGAVVQQIGLYIDTVNSYLGCDSIIQTNLSIVPLPIFSIGNDTSICSSTELNLQVPYHDNWQYVWQSNNTQNIEPIRDSGWYVLQVTAAPCTVQTDSAFIKILNCDCKIAMPNAFTPNGDQLHDAIKPIIDCDLPSTEYYFAVYNRWGEKIFETIDVQAAWDGTYKQTPQPIETYRYIIKYYNPNTKILEQHAGDFELLK